MWSMLIADFKKYLVHYTSACLCNDTPTKIIINNQIDYGVKKIYNTVEK